MVKQPVKKCKGIGILCAGLYDDDDDEQVGWKEGNEVILKGFICVLLRFSHKTNLVITLSLVNC